MLAFLISPLGRVCGAVVAVLAILAGVWGLGHHSETVAVQKRDAAAKADIKTHEATAATISATAQVSGAQQQERIRTVTRTLIEKVPVYVPASADAQCVVPRGFVQLHDAAAAGLPSPTGGPDQAPSGVELSAVAETVAANYGACRAGLDEAMRWRKWWADQKAAWDAR
jgi:hypothetical protein